MNQAPTPQRDPPLYIEELLLVSLLALLSRSLVGEESVCAGTDARLVLEVLNCDRFEDQGEELRTPALLPGPHGSRQRTRASAG